MKITRLLTAVSLCALLAVSCHSGKSGATCGSLPEINHGFPSFGADGKVAVVAHRGFWQCEEGGFSRNSVAALKAAQDNGFWGSECDIYLTRDEQIIVFHDGDIDGMKFSEHDYAEYADFRLPNGEPLPTFEAFLNQLATSRSTKLVIEFKAVEDIEWDLKLVDKTFAMLKEHGLYDPDRVAFISFSFPVCCKVAADAPEFMNQYLRGDMTPEDLSSYGINGIDYHFSVIIDNRYFGIRSHCHGMSVNSWTVNERDTVFKMLNRDVDAITSDDPLMVRGILGDNELKN